MGSELPRTRPGVAAGLLVPALLLVLAGACSGKTEEGGVEAVPDPPVSPSSAESPSLPARAIELSVLGARVVGRDLAAELVRAFVGAVFSGEERHRRRLGKIAAIETGRSS